MNVPKNENPLCKVPAGTRSAQSASSCVPSPMPTISSSAVVGPSRSSAPTGHPPPPEVSSQSVISRRAIVAPRECGGRASATLRTDRSGRPCELLACGAGSAASRRACCAAQLVGSRSSQTPRAAAESPRAAGLPYARAASSRTPRPRGARRSAPELFGAQRAQRPTAHATPPSLPPAASRHAARGQSQRVTPLPRHGRTDPDAQSAPARCRTDGPRNADVPLSISVEA